MGKLYIRRLKEMVSKHANHGAHRLGRHSRLANSGTVCEQKGEGTITSRSSSAPSDCELNRLDITVIWTAEN